MIDETNLDEGADFVSFLVDRYHQVYSWVDTLSIELVLRMTAASSARTAASSRFFKGQGLERTSGRFAVLRALFFTSGSTERQMALSDISVVLDVTNANITSLVDGLEKDGFVERVPHPTDRRSFIVCLTPRGEEVCRELMPGLAQLVADECAGLDDATKLLVIQAMKRIRQNALRSFREGSSDAKTLIDPDD